ncbi:hypothetical protein [Pseudactinotalea terrae]|uniref:hypothetical protein n=1 Tax=Pseudactinotalea terrae TaxID=1743262 RepID=UPI0012E23165|nr:hypothetical protein [Pseudactinotalea terrae]
MNLPKLTAATTIALVALGATTASLVATAAASPGSYPLAVSEVPDRPAMIRGVTLTAVQAMRALLPHTLEHLADDLMTERAEEKVSRTDLPATAGKDPVDLDGVTTSGAGTTVPAASWHTEDRDLFGKSPSAGPAQSPVEDGEEDYHLIIDLDGTPPLESPIEDVETPQPPIELPLPDEGWTDPILDPIDKPDLDLSPEDLLRADVLAAVDQCMLPDATNTCGLYSSIGAGATRESGVLFPNGPLDPSTETLTVTEQGFDWDLGQMELQFYSYIDGSWTTATLDVHAHNDPSTGSILIEFSPAI